MSCIPLDLAIVSGLFNLVASGLILFLNWRLQRYRKIIEHLRDQAGE